MDLHYKQEITVGALVVLGIGLFVVGTMWLGGRSFSRAATFAIAFEDAGTLKRGSPVKVSGVNLGTVHAIEFQGYRKVLVRVRLDPRVQPRSDASAELATVGLVADAILNFNPGSAPDPLPEGAVIVGTVDKGFMEIGTELSAKAKEAITNFSELANKNLADELSKTLSAMQRMANLYADPKTGPSAELTQTLSEMHRLGARVDSLLSGLDLSGTARRADSVLNSLAQLSTDARSAAARFDTLLARVNRGEGTLGKFVTDTAFYGNAQRTLKALQEFIDDLRKHPGKLGLTVRVF